VGLGAGLPGIEPWSSSLQSDAILTEIPQLPRSVAQYYRDVHAVFLSPGFMGKSMNVNI
jgi:hypothetical protein